MLLRGRSILVVGDSINEEIFLTLANSLFLVADEASAPFDPRTPIEVHVCNGTVYLKFVRNDRLSLIRSPHMENPTFREYPFIFDIDIFDIIILNRGAHFEESGIVLRAIEEALSFIEIHSPGAKVIWRTTPRGHSNFASVFHAPPLVVEEDVTNLPFNWGNIVSQNRDVVQFIENRFPCVLIFDVAPILNLRHDYHKDGLHYTIPGPLDLFSRVFFHFLPDILSR